LPYHSLQSLEKAHDPPQSSMRRTLLRTHPTGGLSQGEARDTVKLVLNSSRIDLRVHTGDDHSHLLAGQLWERLALVPRFCAMIHANMGDVIRSLLDHPETRNGRVVPGRPTLREYALHDSPTGAATYGAPENRTYSRG